MASKKDLARNPSKPPNDLATFLREYILHPNTLESHIRAIDGSLDRYARPAPSRANSAKVVHRLAVAAEKFATALQAASTPLPDAFLRINDPWFYIQMETADAELAYPAALITEARRIEASAKAALPKLKKPGGPIREAKMALGFALCDHWELATGKKPGLSKTGSTLFKHFVRLAIARSSTKADLETNFSDWIYGVIKTRREWSHLTTGGQPDVNNRVEPS